MKRFVDTNRWSESWFNSLPSHLQHLWDYIWDRADNSGVWSPNWREVEFHTGLKINKQEAALAFAEKITQLPNGKWWIVEFIPFQFGQLSEVSRVHQSVLSLIEKNGIDTLCIAYKYPIHRAKDKDKYKDKDKDSSLEEGLGEKPARATGSQPETSQPSPVPPEPTETRRPSGIPRSEAEAVQWAEMEAVPPAFARDVFHGCEATGWIDGAKRPIINWRSYIKSRHSRQKTIDTTPARRLSVADLSKAIAIKEERYQKLRGRFFNPDHGNWSDKKASEEAGELRKQIKGLKAQIEQMTEVAA